MDYGKHKLQTCAREDEPRLQYTGNLIQEFRTRVFFGTGLSLDYFKSDEGKNYWKNYLRQKAVNENEGAQKK